MSWTEDRIATLTKMWEGGATASQIADELGGVSRNAVIGKAHRLGLKSRPSPVKANEKKAAPAAKKKKAAPAKPAPWTYQRFLAKWATVTTALRLDTAVHVPGPATALARDGLYQEKTKN